MRRILTAPPVLAAVLAIIALYAVSAGSVAVPTSDTLAVVTAKLMGHEPFIDPAVTDIIWELRVPRVLLAMAAGAGLALAGAAISALCVAATNFIVYMAADAEGMQSAAFWTMGSLADAKWRSLFLPVLVVSALAVYFLSQLRTLDVLLLGEELAVTLGIDASAKRRLYMGLLALLTGVLVATCGIIGFVGLVVPHLVRSFTGASHRRLLPAALLFGALFLVVADLLARTLLPAGDLPIGIITALIGAPLFMKLLFGSGGNFGGSR